MKRKEKQSTQGFPKTRAEPIGHRGDGVLLLTQLDNFLNSLLSCFTRKGGQVVLDGVWDQTLAVWKIHSRASSISARWGQRLDEPQHRGVSAEDPVPAADFEPVDLFVGRRDW